MAGAAIAARQQSPLSSSAIPIGPFGGVCHLRGAGSGGRVCFRRVRETPAVAAKEFPAISAADRLVSARRRWIADRLDWMAAPASAGRGLWLRERRAERQDDPAHDDS